MRISFGKPKPRPASAPAKETAPARHTYTGKAGTLDKEFLEEFCKGRVCLSLGTKGSGKIYLSLHYLEYCLNQGTRIYQKIYLCIPNYDHEQNDSYRFIKQYKGPAKIFVCSGWDPYVIDKIKAADPKLKEFCFVDDASGYLTKTLDQDTLKFISSCRHYSTSLWLVFHVLRSGMPASFRAQIDGILIFEHQPPQP